MDARYACSQGDIQAIVYQNLSTRSRSEIPNPTHKFKKLARRQILFTNLNHIHPGRDGTPRTGEDIALPPVRHVITNHSVVVDRLISDFQKYRSSENPSRTS